MQTWNQLFVRQGWMLEQIEENCFNFKTDSKVNVDFLFECLEKAGVEFSEEAGRLILHSNPYPRRNGWRQSPSHTGAGAGIFGFVQEWMNQK